MYKDTLNFSASFLISWCQWWDTYFLYLIAENIFCISAHWVKIKLLLLIKKKKKNGQKSCFRVPKESLAQRTLVRVLFQTWSVLFHCIFLRDFYSFINLVKTITLTLTSRPSPLPSTVPQALCTCLAPPPLDKAPWTQEGVVHFCIFNTWSGVCHTEVKRNFVQWINEWI